MRLDYVVKLTLQGDAFWVWEAEPMLYLRDSLNKFIGILNQASTALHTAASKEKLQLALRVRSSVAESHKIDAALQDLKAHVVQLRFLETPHDVMAQFLPFNQVQTLEIVLLQHGDEELTLSAMQGLPRLQAVKLYARTAARCNLKPNRVTCFLEKLGRLKTVTSWTVALLDHSVCLPSQALGKLTSLHLSTNVTAQKLPAELRRLRLQNLGSPQRAAEWAETLQKVDHLECLSMDTCTEESLLQLPPNLVSLELLARSEQRLTQHVDDPDCNFSAALGRFAGLQVLCIGCFLTTELFQSLHGVVLRDVHTFGFQLPSVIGQGERCVQEGGVINFKPDDDVVQLRDILPAMRTLKIFFKDVYVDVDRVHGCVQLESGLLTPQLFPNLQYIVCCCQLLDLELVDVSPSCQVIRKY